MKTRHNRTGKTTLLFFLLIFGMTFQANAQFFKKLKNKVEKKVEQTVIRKTSDKAAQKAGEQMDKVFNIGGKKSDVDPASLPDAYEFDWQYTITMTTQNKDFIMDYYLKPDAKYFGAIPSDKQATPGGNMFMVMDIEKNINTIFMDMDGGKSAFVMDVDYSDSIEDENDKEDFTITEIEGKEILGYDCKGFKMENDEVEMLMYFTNDAPVSFTQIYGFDAKNVPKGFDKKWLDYGKNALMMEMDFKNKKKKKHSSKMVCTGLVEIEKSIDVRSYQFLGQGFSSKQ